MDVRDSGQAGAIEITSKMIDAGVLALIRHYDADEDGLDNSRVTVSAIIAAVLKNDNHVVNLSGCVARELS